MEEADIEKLVIQNAPNCLMCVDPSDLAISYKNKSAHKLFNQLNISPEFFPDIFETSEKDKIFGIIFNHAEAEDDPSDIDCRLRSPKEQWVNIRLSKAKGTYIICLVDVTRNRKKLSRIEMSEALLNEAQHISKIGSFNVNLETNEIYWSNEGFQIFGLDPSKHKASKQAYLDIIHPEDVNFVSEKMKYISKVGGAFSFQYRIRLPNGIIKTIFQEGRSLIDDNGSVKSVGGFYEDISNISELRKSLLVEQDRLTKILSNIEEVVFFVTITGPNQTDRKIEFISSNSVELFGATPEEFYSQGPSIVFDRVHPDDAYLFKTEMHKLRTEKKQISFIHRVKNIHSDNYKYIENSFVPILDQHNEVSGFYASARNIDHKIVQEKILKINEKRLLEAEKLAKLGHWDWNFNSNELFWSDEIYKIFNISKEKGEISYSKFLSFVHP